MRKRSFEEFVMTYKTTDSEGNESILVSIEDYHKRFIKPLDPRFQWDFYNGYKGKVLCWCKNHEDKNPSMGTVPHKHLKGVKLYHCLGCNATGTVVRLHQRIQQEYFGRTITDHESCMELCNLYGIDAKEYEKVETDQEGYFERYRSIDDLKEEYTIKEYSSDILGARKAFAVSGNLNTLKRTIDSANVKMIATEKGWMKE